MLKMVKIVLLYAYLATIVMSAEKVMSEKSVQNLLLAQSSAKFYESKFPEVINPRD